VVCYILPNPISLSDPSYTPIPGTLAPVGGDFGLYDANGTGTFYPDVKQTFLTDDGAVIQVFETGASQPDGTAHVKIGFETGFAKYTWLNGVVAVGILTLDSASVIEIDVWQVS
jgi:hypothetical protein